MTLFAHSGPLGGITLPLEIFRDPRLNGSEISLLVALLEFRDGKTGRINVGGAAIEAVSGLPKQNLCRTIKRLVAYGWVTYDRGSEITPNDYTLLIPLETDFKYRVRVDKYTDDGWKAEKKRRKDNIKKYTRRRVRDRDEWWALSAEELVDELRYEKTEGTHYIPDDILENWCIVRGADNSERARERRREEGPGGVKDIFDTDALDDLNNPALLQDLANM